MAKRKVTRRPKAQPQPDVETRLQNIEIVVAAQARELADLRERYTAARKLIAVLMRDE